MYLTVTAPWQRSALLEKCSQVTTNLSAISKAAKKFAVAAKEGDTVRLVRFGDGKIWRLKGTIRSVAKNFRARQQLRMKRNLS